MVTIQDNNMINKFISKPETKKYNKTQAENLLNYKDYFKKNLTLKAYKIPELKMIAKHHGLHVTGTKPVLIERIKDIFNKTKCVVKIQTVFRGWLTRLSMKLRGPGLTNRTSCVNDKDFVTMEPLVEIPLANFYSYMDDKKFIYGFDICSLLHFIKQKSKIENPYNREKLGNEITNNIKKLYRFCFIVFPEFKNDNEKLAATAPPPMYQQRVAQHNVNNANINVININNHMNQEQQNRISRLFVNRRNSINQRITDLFMEMDQLGNYTNTNWFNLSASNYIRLYRHLYDIWFLRSQLTRETRHNICPLVSPFTAERNMVLDLDYIKTACVEVFENLIFMGIDDEHRRLGTFHALTALTIVSPGAREAMPWLYESVAGW
uniref:SAP domain-containing protein n=1 Tax=viral metagenome TaxID=1070528 RepID=A0A6C0LAD8_9ZZZZ